MDTLRVDARFDADAYDDANAGGAAPGGRRRRRHWSREDKARIVSESAEPGVSISEVARRHGLNRGLLTAWRRAAGLDVDTVTPRTRAWGSAVPGFIPVEVMEDARDGLGGSTCRPASAGRIEVDLRSGRVSMSGDVDPALARSVLGALRGV